MIHAISNIDLYLLFNLLITFRFNNNFFRYGLTSQNKACNSQTVYYDRFNLIYSSCWGFNRFYCSFCFLSFNSLTFIVTKVQCFIIQLIHVHTSEVRWVSKKFDKLICFFVLNTNYTKMKFMMYIIKSTFCLCFLVLTCLYLIHQQKN